MSTYRLMVPVFVAVFFMAGDSLAQGRSVAVHADGSMRALDSSHAMLQVQDCESDPDLFFVYTETVSADELTVQTGAVESGSIDITVTIDLACGQGQAAFNYAHEGSALSASSGLSVQPLNPALNIPVASGASASVSVTYQLGNNPPRSGSIGLFHERITFVIDEVFGQTANRQQLATIRVQGDVLDAELIGNHEHPRIREAGRVLIDACRSAEPGTDFADACDEIRDHATSEQQQVQVANAFDAHGLSALVMWAGESGRIQDANIAARLSELRMGGSGQSGNGLSLTFNGRNIDRRWLPSVLRMGEEGDDSRLLGDRWGVFVNGSFNLGRRSERGKEVGFDFDAWSVTTGVDYRFDNGSVAGLAAGYGSFDADLEQDGGDVDGDTRSLQAFGTVNIGTDLYVDLIAGHSRIDFSQDRTVDLSGIGQLMREVARGATDAEAWSASIAANYRKALDNGVTITPYGKFYWADVDIDGFTETGSVFSFEYPDQAYTSRVWSAGLRASRAVNLEQGVLMPYADLSWQYQDGIDAYTVETVLSGTSLSGPSVDISEPDRSFGRFDAGLSWVSPSGNQAYVSYSALLFERDTRLHSIFIGGRWEF